MAFAGVDHVNAWAAAWLDEGGGGEEQPGHQREHQRRNDQPPLRARGNLAIAAQLGLPPEPLVLAVLFGCNLSYATPIAYQTNMLIMAEGDYKFNAYLKTGIPLVVLMVASLSAILSIVYGL